MSNAMASHTGDGDNPQEQSSTNEKGKDKMIEGMEGGRHEQDHLANCKPLRNLSENIKNVKQFSSEACIFKVHEDLRKPNPEAYKPLKISIGPYHHGKSELRKMERLKELYTQSFLNRGEGLGAEECWKELKGLIGRAERYYGDEYKEEVSGEEEFLKMLLLDGCFTVEFVVRRCLVYREEEEDPIDMIEGLAGDIRRDMLLLENQLPFFVLQELYGMISFDDGKPEFWNLVKYAFRNKVPKINIMSLPTTTEVIPQEIKHLLEVVHILCRPPSRPNNGQIHQQREPCSSCCFWKERMNCACFLCMFGEQPQGQGGRSTDTESHRHRHFTCFLCRFWEQSIQDDSADVDDLCSSIRTASELQEAGVEFKKVGKISDTFNETISLFDIKFNHGVLEIPSFALYDPTESFFRNLIAYEQHSRNMSPMSFTDYAKFMDDLINTEKDVSLLRLKDIFLNGLGDDKEVTHLFNNLCKGVSYSSDDDFYYKDVCKELNRHCKKPWNAAMAKLRRNFFHSPWAGISTFAAILLLTLAITQTVIAVLDLRK